MKRFTGFVGMLALAFGLLVFGCASSGSTALTNTALGGSASSNKLAGTRWIMKGFFGDDVLTFIDQTRWELTGFGGQKTWSGTYSIDGDYVYAITTGDTNDKLSYRLSKDGNILTDQAGNTYTKVK
jgi:hypothetical protein